MTTDEMKLLKASNKTREIFGKEMYRARAMLLSYWFNRNITIDNVKELDREVTAMVDMAIAEMKKEQEALLKG